MLICTIVNDENGFLRTNVNFKLKVTPMRSFEVFKELLVLRLCKGKKGTFS